MKNNNDVFLKELVKTIHQYKKGLEQEFFINANADFIIKNIKCQL